MSFVTAIKDYIDLLNNVYDSVSVDITWQHFIQQTFLYLFSSLKFLIIYLISFQWLKDLAYLPILVPQISTTILKENYFLDTHLSTFFTLLETPTYHNNKFIIGFLNSFFLCLPLSTTHLISMRRLLVEGVAAGMVSSLGTIIGYTCFLFSVLFGLRLFVIPWFSYEPLSYIIGIFFTLTVVYDMATQRVIEKYDWSQKSKLIQIFCINFILTWTEQSSVFTYFGNLTLNAQPTILDNFSSITGTASFLAHGSYLLGIVLGSLFFTTLFIYLCLELTNLSLKLSGLNYSRWLRKTNFSLLVLIIAFTFTSIPFYSLDYLFGGALGFTSQDKILEKTFLSSTKLPKVYKKLRPLGTDVTPFDRGIYLLLPLSQSFEELNYQGEYAWTSGQGVKTHSGAQKRARKFVSALFKRMNPDSDQKETESDNLNTTRTSSQKALLESTSSKKNSSSEQNINSKLAESKNNTVSEDSNLVPLATNDFLEDIYNIPDLEEEDLETIFQDNGPSEYFFTFNDRINTASRIDNAINLPTDLVFSPDFLDDPFTFVNPELEKRVKEKYYSNPVYKLLLNADIDLFLRRQPSTYLLSPKDEKTLFEKRLLLSNYYDSLRYYQNLPYAKDFQTLFNGSKSYADRVYNQQFKGTLKVVRRLFSITFNEENNLSNKIILKFDQPLYKNLKHTNSIIGHEELILNTPTNKPFLELTNPIPFYTGWDEQLRKFVITNRLLSRSEAGFSMQFENNKQIKDYPTLTELLQNTQKIDFTMWPLTKNLLEKPKSSSTIPYAVLYEQLDDTKAKSIKNTLGLSGEDAELRSMPPIINRITQVDPTKFNDVIVPTRGGFIWPGHSYLKISFKNFVPLNVPFLKKAS